MKQATYVTRIKSSCFHCHPTLWSHVYAIRYSSTRDNGIKFPVVLNRCEFWNVVIGFLVMTRVT